eukprot:jgi/Tetstr1/430863/TSEL_002005.t1
MIDFACVSSTTPTWSNDPRWCTPGIAATEAEHGKLAADRASSAPVQGVHRYYPFVVEDRGRLGKSALTVVYIFAVLLAVRNFPGVRGSLIRFGETRAAERAAGAMAAATVSMHPARPAFRGGNIRIKEQERAEHADRATKERADKNKDYKDKIKGKPQPSNLARKITTPQTEEQN